MQNQDKDKWLNLTITQVVWQWCLPLVYTGRAVCSWRNCTNKWPWVSVVEAKLISTSTTLPAALTSWVPLLTTESLRSDEQVIYVPIYHCCGAKFSRLSKWGRRALNFLQGIGWKISHILPWPLLNACPIVSDQPLPAHDARGACKVLRWCKYQQC